MNHRCFTLLLACFVSSAYAMQIRNYVPAVHDRFLNYPASPAINPTFLFDGNKFTGAGWFNPDTHRQCALVSPKHFIAATHLSAAIGQNIWFLGSDGVVMQRSVSAFTPVESEFGGHTDLALVTLNLPVGPTVKVFPWLNLEDEAAYINTELMVFGAISRAGRGVLDSFLFATADPSGGGPTRFYTFPYVVASGDDNDGSLLGGDSGSPTFALSASGQAAVLGCHSATEEADGVVTNYDSFLPHYISSLDEMLEPDGYRMRPANFTPTTLNASSAPTPSPPPALEPAAQTFSVANSGTEDTGNLDVVLSFSSGSAPDSISAPDCVTTSLSAGVWTVRKSTLPAASSIQITTTWASAPNLAGYTVNLVAQADTAPTISAQYVVPVEQTYADWSQGLPGGAPADDPDADGIANILEYAFGSPPLSGETVLFSGSPAKLAIQVISGNVVVTFPERVTAASLGLVYTLETTAELASPPWSSSLPPGAVSTTSPYVPPVAGFIKRTVTWPATSPLIFARVKVLQS